MKHVSLIFGVEEFLVNRQLKKILKSTLGTDERNAYTEYDLLEVSLNAALEDCETIPFFEEKKVVVCKNPFFLTGQKVKTNLEHDLNGLSNYLKNPADFTHLVFVLNYEKLDSRKKIVKEFKKLTNIFESNMMKEEEIVSTIIKIFGNHDKKISNQNAKLIVSKVGNRFSLVYQEITKLLTYIGDDEVTAEAIEKIISRTLEENIFDLVDMILKRKKERAIQIFYDLLDLKEEPVKIIVLVANQIRLLYQCKVLFKKGLAEYDISKKIGVHPYRVKLARQASRDFETKQLLDLLDKLTDLDYQIKSGKINKVTGLELFIMKI